MPQQINLCTPVLLTPKRQFTAQRLARALVVVLVLGGVASALWVHNLERASTALRATVEAQQREAETLKTAIAQSRARHAPVDDGLQKQFQQRQDLLLQRQSVLVALQLGVAMPGQGHSDRLAWIARSIPPAAWVTELRMDAGLLEINGLTLEPAALSDWVSGLSANPALGGLQLSAVRVDKLDDAARGAANLPSGRSVWRYTLASAAPKRGDAP